MTLGLPRKLERIELVELSAAERNLYDFLKRRPYLIASGKQPAKHTRSAPYMSGNALVLISVEININHGEELLPAVALEAWKKRYENSVVWDTLESSLQYCDTCGLDIDDGPIEFPCQHIICDSCISVGEGDSKSPGPSSCPMCGSNASSVSSCMSEPAAPNGSYQSSSKDNHQKGNVVFSYWTKMLGLIQTGLNENGMKFQRIDCQSSLA
ncbi:Fc.00g083910.m01.CDS01 [Cosmosporella sp. VM-42]